MQLSLHRGKLTVEHLLGIRTSCSYEYCNFPLLVCCTVLNLPEVILEEKKAVISSCAAMLFWEGESRVEEMSPLCFHSCGCLGSWGGTECFTQASQCLKKLILLLPSSATRHPWYLCSLWVSALPTSTTNRCTVNTLSFWVAHLI